MVNIRIHDFSILLSRFHSQTSINEDEMKKSCLDMTRVTHSLHAIGLQANGQARDNCLSITTRPQNQCDLVGHVSNLEPETRSGKIGLLLNRMSGLLVQFLLDLDVPQHVHCVCCHRFRC